MTSPAARLAGLLLVVASLAASAAGTLAGRVVDVIDGDTLTLQRTGHPPLRIRLAFVDAPERGQAHWRQARDGLAERVLGRRVQVRPLSGDRYGRVLGQVWLARTDINCALLGAGLAWHDVHHAQRIQGGASFARYQSAQHYARSHRLGLWRQSRPQAPWRYRQRRGR
ncbi:thermonuclease family protein [Microvirgula aerodenitrificans]|uniref:thermonuclease family protein n=1 Tax=Microvirgula aerodenitrificans TaxID=57480 RepID=UPI00248DADF4|nr:thermonuclease family protein [Microvirgula aerodenitrificans]